MTQRTLPRAFMKLAAALGTIVLVSCAGLGADDPAELERTLRAAEVGIPSNKLLKSGNPLGFYKDFEGSLRVKPGAKIPLVIYLHGCSGFGGSSYVDHESLVDNGFAVIAPSHLARKYAPSKCGGYLEIGMRIAEARYAYQKAVLLPWVDKHNMFLMGHSHGGMTTAQYPHKGFSGRIITGWGCQSTHMEWYGLAKPGNEPVLSILAENDSWLSRYSTPKGDCGEFMSSKNGSNSIVAKNSRYHSVHTEPEYQERIIQFLNTQIRR